MRLSLPQRAFKVQRILFVRYGIVYIAHKFVEVCAGVLLRLDIVIRCDSWTRKYVLDQVDDAFSICELFVLLKSVLAVSFTPVSRDR